ncbi:MAG: amidohydrolase [Parvularculaceae bacterium]
MKPLSLLAALAACACAACADKKADDGSPAGRADAIFVGGPIYTGLETQPTVEAVAVARGRIVKTGDRAEVEAAVEPGARIVDLEGAALYPGFTDSHAHLLGIGLRELTLNLEGVESLAALVEIVRAEAARTPAGETISGRGWIETHWPEERFPTRHDLDTAAPDHPVILRRADGHASVANSRALELAGVTAATPDPKGGEILKDDDGAPTGMLIDAAQGLVAGLLPPPSPARKAEAYERAGAVYAAYGWTGMHNMSVDPADLGLMERLAEEGALPIRVYNSIDVEGFDALAANGPRQDKTGRIVTRALKLYADGALGSRGAALSEPYSDAPDTTGLLQTDHDEIMPVLTKALEKGVQVNTHAIGDRGNRLVLDWYEEAFNAVPENRRMVAKPRWRIEHAQIVHVEDIPRFAANAVIPSMQPSHAIGDLYFAPDRLGADRLDGAYAWRSLLDAGAIIAAGSDAPVERGDPRIEFYAAVARRGLDGYQNQNWRPNEAVTREEALKMFTTWPAYAAFQEDALGTIEVGKRADFTVFSKDIMTIPAEEILKVETVMTVVDGEIVYRNQ